MTIDLDDIFAEYPTLHEAGILDVPSSEMAKATTEPLTKEDLVKAFDAWRGTDNESAETPTACEFRDLTCPCNDGDQCHYTGTNPMPSKVWEEPTNE